MGSTTTPGRRASGGYAFAPGGTLDIVEVIRDVMARPASRFTSVAGNVGERLGPPPGGARPAGQIPTAHFPNIPRLDG
jgi:hypothetical protein